MEKGNSLEEFQEFRLKMNEKIARSGTLITRRFFTLDDRTYKEGELSIKTKELMGMVASMVLRCDDCISYHIIQGILKGATDKEFWETFDIALIVGGSIVIPHLRRAVARLEECRVMERNDIDKLRLAGQENPYD